MTDAIFNIFALCGVWLCLAFFVLQAIRMQYGGLRYWPRQIWALVAILVLSSGAIGSIAIHHIINSTN